LGLQKKPRSYEAEFANLRTEDLNHRDTESTEGTIFLPDREMAIGQKIAALRARSSNPVVSYQRWELG
ncbi:MAG: hypothetical protein PVH39_02215, partial [Syntrophobacterales bacterium]